MKTKSKKMHQLFGVCLAKAASEVRIPQARHAKEMPSKRNVDRASESPGSHQENGLEVVGLAAQIRPRIGTSGRSIKVATVA